MSACKRHVARAAWAACLLMLTTRLGAASWHSGDRSGQMPGWLPQGDVSPFFPDDAFSIQLKDEHYVTLRTTFDLERKPVRAVLALSGWHTLAVYLNDTMVQECHHVPPDRIPEFAEVGAWIRPGTNRIEVRIWSEWTPNLYLQLRLENPDGSFADVISNASWQGRPGAPESWPRGTVPDDAWTPVEQIDDYYGTGGTARTWHREFALMPRQLLTARMERHNRRLRAAWERDAVAPGPLFKGTYTRDDYAPQYTRHLRLDEASGQAVDATGTIRHLFFTVYNQKVDGEWTLSWDRFDGDRLEHDLTLMEQSGVHPYLRFLGWQQLLDGQGNWKRCERQPTGSGVPTVTYAYEILDYFLDRCQAHGRFVMVECDFFWGANWDAIPPPYHTRYYLYPEVVEASALAHRRILTRYRDRAVIAGFMMGEEDIIMNQDLENPHLRAEFARSQQRRHGSLAQLTAAWGQGYDAEAPNAWRTIERQPDMWGQTEKEPTAETVLYPTPPLKADYWNRLSSWQDIPLPTWPHCRWPEPPKPDLPSHRGFVGDMGGTTDDPVWIDYNAMREDELYLSFVSTWYRIVREGVPNHWIFHSNAQDYTSQWHFLHMFRRAELPHQVIGVGSHDSGKNLSEIPLWDRQRKAIRVISSYRPYVCAPGSPALAVASGEGEGGRAGDEAEIRDYYRAQSLDMVGNGAAFEMSYTWDHISGAREHETGEGHVTQALAWTGEFYTAVQGVRFSLPRSVPILIVRNNNLQRSNRSGRDYGNTLALAATLGQLNVPFDIAMDRDLSCGEQDRRIDITHYRMVFLPSIECDYPDDVWDVLDRWVNTSDPETPRTLVLGSSGLRSPYMVPTKRFHPVLQRWLGAERYADTVSLRGANTLRWSPTYPPNSAARQIRLHVGERPDISPVGTFTKGTPLLQVQDGRAIAMSSTVGHTRIVAFGFPLGLAFDNLWGLPAGLAGGKPADQEPFDILAQLYENVVDTAGVDRPIHAPHHIRVAVSDDQSTILIREMCGMEATDLCTLDLPAGAAYSGCDLVPQGDGRVLIRARLPAFGGLCLKRRL